MIEGLVIQRLRGLSLSPLVVAGYCLSLAYSGTAQSSPVTPFAPESAFTSAFGAAFQIGYLSTFFLVAVFAYVARFDARSYVAYAAIVSNVIGGVLQAAALVILGRAEIMVVSCVFTGVGCALIFVAWLIVLEARPLRTATCELLIGSFCAACFAAAMQSVVPAGCMDAVRLVLGLASLPMVLLAQRRHGAASPRWVRGKAEDAGFGPLAGLLRTMFLSTVCGSLLVAVGPIMAFSVINGQSDLSELAWAANTGHIVAVAALFVVLVCLRRRVGLAQAFIAVFPVVATMLLLLSYGGVRWGVIFLAVMYCAYNLTSLLIIDTSLHVARDSSMPAAIPYGFMAGFVYSSSTLGAWVGSFLGGFFLESTAVSMIALALLYLLSIAMLVASRLKAKRGQGEVEDVLSEKCRAIAREFDLTTREGEVLDHLAHGKNVPAMSEAMLLSKDTVRTHVKSLYRKVDVHSRQDLLAFVERTRLP